ncbi:MAG: Mfa1 fimbrilin C-terminal domain-containing protein [Alistipes sp.]|nr:Mfa1 fimbrilin C-terminal domain-containing protein [Alistipes sp.]
MKKYLFLAIAALGFAACSDSDLNGGKDPIHKGEIEESYIAINLSASDITRAADGYHDGTEDERKVNHADFFFFDGDGNAFPVTIADGTVTSPGVAGGVNHLHVSDIDFTQDGNTGDDISDNTSEAVLLLKTYKGQYPSQIVAVLNWSPGDKSYSLEELKLAVDLYGAADAAGHFIMSNAVYADGTTAVYAAPLTADNIKSNEAEAKTKPVTIYVERVAAKVTVNIPSEKLTDKGYFDLSKEYVPASGGPAQKVYAEVLGWDLYRDNTQSKLLKEIDASWTTDAIGFAWNDSPWYRSYWATSLVAPNNDPIYGVSPFAVGATAYIGENTTENNTKVVIKAKLVNAGGTAVEIAHWNNVEYAGNLALRIAVANTLKNTYYALNGTTYTGILPDDLQCVAGGSEGAPTGVKANEVYFQLSADGKNKDWYKLVNGEYKNVADNIANDQKSTDAMNAALKSVPSAVLYTNGETFYYVDIKHLGAANSAAEFGIVRNHAYNITINSIKGYGSPVYTGTEFVDYPSTPDQNTFVSAKINILSWRLVDQEVDIQPQN